MFYLIFISIINAVIILGLSYLFISKSHGIFGIGYAWLIGQVVVSGIYWVLWAGRLRGREGEGGRRGERVKKNIKLK